MTTPRRGFSKERHGGLKAGLTGIAMAGFALAWAGFERSHDAVDAPPTASPATETPAPTRTPAPPVGTSTAGSTPVPTPTTLIDEEPQPLPTRAKRSRGS